MHDQLVARASSILMVLLVAWAGACGNGDAAGNPSGAPPVTATPGTALHHAQVCAKKLGRIPTWACQDGVQVPILVDGGWYAVAMHGFSREVDRDHP
ncbi:MAG: hypothetical protein L6Q84_21640 [Polyangiaceae bacterium]|nr:hypothetical protein [Polyangiaceae bacterium]